MNSEPLASSLQPLAPNPQCNHTLHAIDNEGNTTGSWWVRASKKKNGPQRRKVVCRYCGKFYGYLDDKRK